MARAPAPKKAKTPSKDKASGTTKKERVRTVFPGVYERGIGGRNPHFQVKLRHRNYPTVIKRFPYIPDGDSGKGQRRDNALNDAINFSTADKSHFHFYGKPKVAVAKEHTLREWILGWKQEVCDALEPNDPSYRQGGVEDGKQAARLIKIADEYAIKHKRESIMNKRVMDELLRSDIVGTRGLINMLTGRPPKRIKGEDPQAKPSASPATQRRALALLGIIWNHARDSWDIDIKRPWEGHAIKAKEKAKGTRALSLKEIEALEKALALVSTDTRAAIYFLRWTGARSGEMKKLRWEHISWAPQNGKKFSIVKFVGTKTPRQGAYRERDVPLLDGALAALQLLYKGSPPKTGIVFKSPTNPSEPISRHTAYQAFVRAIRRAELPHARLHDLRHTRTTEYAIGLPKAQAMVVSGHSDERTFMRYTHLHEATAAMISDSDDKLLKQFMGKTGEPSGGKVDPKAISKLVKGMKLTNAQRMKLIAELAALGDD